jgi:hypothetical protein
MKFRMDELDKIRKLNADDINAAVRKYLAPEKLVAVRAGDFEKIQEEKGEAKGKAKKKPKSADADEES